jgi:hypothetical protein
MRSSLAVTQQDSEAVFMKAGANMPRSRRRARGEGLVFQRKDGRWVVQAELGDGKRKQYYVKTEKEGIKKLRQVQLELEQ